VAIEYRRMLLFGPEMGRFEVLGEDHVHRLLAFAGGVGATGDQRADAGQYLERCEDGGPWQTFSYWPGAIDFWGRSRLMVIERLANDERRLRERAQGVADAAGADVQSARTATAKGSVYMSAETLRLIVSGGAAKGDVLTTAQLAGTMAAKRTHELIPLCHPLPLTGIDVSLEPDEKRRSIDITATVRTTGKTGVEMEALTAVSVAALTVYDMAKAVQKDMRIGDIRLVRKRGGKSGDIDLE